MLLIAVDPLIGGVLVRGEKGTAKSTAVRGLASVLPDVSVVEGCSFGCDPGDPGAWCHECRERARKTPLPTFAATSAGGRAPASGSMGATKRMQAAKGAAMALLEQAYQRRDRVSMVTFRGDRADVVLPPTSSVELAALKLKDVRTGGSTPLAHGVLKALEVLAAEQRRDPDVVRWLVLVTDGRANVGVEGELGSEDASLAAARVREAGVHMVVLDTQATTTLSPAREIARAAGAEYVRLGSVDAESLADAVRRKL